MNEANPGTLYVVSTPIGNLEDITLRALRVLREAHVVAAEDTRHTRKLLSHFDIHTPMVSFHEHSPEHQRARLLDRLLAGASVALVSDAGTPGVSDPGYPLVFDAVAAGVPVVPIPGASAALSALVASGLPTDRFRFVGFLPRKLSDRRAELSRLAADRDTLIILEAPHRIQKTLTELAEAFGPRAACAARELTKVHEEFIRGPLTEMLERLPDPILGEWTLVIGGSEPLEEASDEADWLEDLSRRLAAGESTRDAARAVSETHRIPRKQAYEAAVNLKP
ncbi:MAG TPA: 16S rRNA (cytidine(1402)-2'-O)-methyltransferase [Armatimonadota bacterium]|jgi:16S rRNA (cytidine1402-2'-O)-methyltransferase